MRLENARFIVNSDYYKLQFAQELKTSTEKTKFMKKVKSAHIFNFHHQ
jgi:hypothetical protein